MSDIERRILRRVVATGVWVVLAASSTGAVPREQAAALHPCLTGERENYGREWAGLSRAVRETYVVGFIDGQSSTYLKAYNDLSADRRESLRRETFLFYDVEALVAVMTDLYRDPANTYIIYSAMIYIARNKLAGDDVESSLRYSRQNDCGIKR
jgi:hypothetical protein